MATSTATGRKRGAQQASAPSRLPSNRERRPLLAVLAVLLIVGGAAAAGLMALRLADRTEYAYLAVELRRGQEIQPGDLGRVPMTLDEVTAARGKAAPTVMTVDQAEGLVGMISTGNYPAGTLATKDMFADSDPFPEGYAKVGMVLTPEQAPTGLAINDQVQIWTAKSEGGPASLAGNGVVVDVAIAGAAGGGGTVTGVSQGQHVTLLVPVGDTAAVAGAGGSGTAILTVSAPETAEENPEVSGGN